MLLSRDITVEEVAAGAKRFISMLLTEIVYSFEVKVFMATTVTSRFLDSTVV